MAVLAALVTLLSTATQAGNSLRVGGTGSAIGLMRQLGAVFAAETEIKIEVLPSLGSSGGIRAVAEGVIDMAVSSRPLKDKERARGLTEMVLARTPFVLASSRPDPDDLKSDDLAEIFRAARATWQDGMPIRIILRPKSETDTKLVADLFPDMAGALVAVRKRGDVPTAATDQDNADLALRMPGSLTTISLAQLVTEKRKLHVIAVDGVKPTMANFVSGRYPFAKTFYFVTHAKRSPEVARFVAFLQSRSGQEALRQAACLPGKS